MEIVAESDRLGIAHAEHIRGAVLRLIGGAGEHDRLLRLEAQCDRLAEETQQIARSIVRIVRSLKAARGLDLTT
ncbi:hypothetical protein [Conexibacter sp. CPCC 206217]|uniref:hypothetical protein n=1 Tax=Conexibacter sp. CPCC 206217 TaxID=3064574 RepID=UPI002725940E|nr:hypothetical protein [Conexibacter sp. CPCC 206217]MDO8209112.1 hypothetical protein [Conexibacter sp. CPCC 206217]